jgi:osmotically inducible protein OsmC
MAITPIDPVYTAEAVSTGHGREGHVRSADGLVDTDVAIPKEMGGPGGATNPEELFASGYAACFHSAMRGVAGQAHLRLPEGTHVTSRVGLGPNGAGGYGLVVSLTAHLPGLPEAERGDLVARAHLVCPYSNATRGNIEVTLATTG